MSKIWFASDHHFGHTNILKFRGQDGGLIRPGFKHIDDMNHYMIQQHNMVVSDQDKVYFLGDVARSQNTLNEVIPQMKGAKRLILGNHDDSNMRIYMPYFKKIYSWRNFHDEDTGVKFVATHFPMHPDSLFGPVTNVHGHIHEKIVRHNMAVDLRYINVCVEMIGYTPIGMDKIVKIIKHRRVSREVQFG